MADQNALTTALKEARLTEAARFDALARVHDARILRLEALRDLVLPEISGSPQLRDLFEINIQDGETPRLWVDLISQVVMDPDPKSYRLTQATEIGPETLFETRDMEQMKRFLVRHIAHRVVAQERSIASKGKANVVEARHYSLGELIYVWVTGILFGVLGLVAYGLASGIFKP